MTDIGARISLDGEKQFKSELAQITQEGKTLSAQMDQLTTSFKNEGKSGKESAEVSKKLSQQIENQEKLVVKLREAVARSTEKTGENSTETLKWKEKLAKAEKGLSNLEKMSRDAASGVDDLGEEEKETSEQTSVFGDVLKANLASQAIISGIKALAGVVKDVAKFFVEAVKGTAEYSDEVITLSNVTGMSTDAIQEYKYAADLLDVDFSTIQGSLTKLTSKMSSAKDGNKAAAEAFEKLGISVLGADGNLRDANEVFDEAITALGKIPNETERDAAAMDIFGKSAKELNPLIEAGADALDNYRKEAHNVGAVLDSNTINQLGEVQDSFDRISGAWDAITRSLGAKIGIKVLPEVEKLTSSFQKLAETGDLEGFVKDVSAQLGKLVKKLPELVRKIAKELPKALKALATSDLWSDLAEAIGDTLAAIFENLPALLEAGGALLGSIIQGAVMILPNMIMRLVNGFDDELDGMDKVTNEHVEAVRKKIAELPDVLSELEQSFSDINAKQRESEHWIEIFDALSQKVNPTAEETLELQNAVDRLNELFPELGLKIDEETGKWSLNTQEIRDNIQAITDRAKADAYMDAASKRYKEIVELEHDRDMLQSELYDIETRLSTATAHAGVLEEQIKAVEELNQKLRDGTITVDEYKAAWYALGMTSEPQFGTMDVYGNKLDLLDGNLVTLKQDLYNTNNAIADLENQRTPLVDGIGDVDAAIGGLNDEVTFFYDQASNIGKPITDALDTAASEVVGEGEEIGKQLDNGIKRGLDTNSGIVSDAARSVVSGVIAAMKATAQIKSPSKLTKNLIGKNLALGVVEGWEDVFDSSKMRNAFSMRGLIGDIAGTTNNTTNLGGVSIIVNSAPGQDTNAIAEAVMRKMQGAVDARRAVFA